MLFIYKLNTTHVLHCISEAVGSLLREVIILLQPSLVRLYLEQYVKSGPHTAREMLRNWKRSSKGPPRWLEDSHKISSDFSLESVRGNVTAVLNNKVSG